MPKMDEKEAQSEGRNASMTTTTTSLQDSNEKNEMSPADVPETLYEGQAITRAITTDRRSTRSKASIRSRAASALSDPTIHITDPGPPPDGGSKAWLQAIMGHLVVTSTWGYIGSYGVFETYYLSSLHESASAISWVGSLQIFLMFAISMFTGRALDAGYFRVVFGAGCIFQLIGVFMTSLCTKYWQLFLAQGICTGIGNGLQFCPVIALVSTYFSSRKSTAMAIAAAGSATGGIIFPIIVRELLPSIGFGWTIRVLGFVILALNITTFSLLRTRLPPRRSGPLIEWVALKESTYVLYVLGMFFNFWGLYFAFYYVGTFARAKVGFSYVDSINLLVVMNAVGMVGRLVPAYFADKNFGPLNTLLPITLFCAVLMYVWVAVHNPAGVYVFACIYGLVAAGIQSLWPATLASLTTDLSKVGTRTGMGFSVVSIATLTGTPLGGAIVADMDGRYVGAQVWAGTCFAVGFILSVAARWCRTGWKLRYRV